MDRFIPSGRLLILGIVVLLFGLLAYQPGYFGDELFPMFAAKTSGSFGEAFLRINEYKPRLIFNGIWGVLAWERAPRYFAGAITWLAMFWAAWAAQRLASNVLGATRLTAFAVGLCVAVSRFGTVFYFDYLSGIVGSMGLAMFLSTVLVAAPLLRGGTPVVARSCAAVAMAIATIFVYEIYIAPFFVLGAVLTFVACVDRQRPAVERRVLAMSGVAAWLLPLILFTVATRLLSTGGIMTGTAGKQVVLSASAIAAFVQFAANTFLGTNIGLPWFTGYFNAGTSGGLIVGVVFASVLLALWAWTVFAGRRRMTRESVLVSLTILGMALATIAIASLPGASLSDARWMFPLSALVALLIVSLPSSLPRHALLCGLLGVSFFHLVEHTYDGIYNVGASRLSGKVARALTSVRPLGASGILVGLPEEQVNWILGGDALQGNDITSGGVYCWINLAPSPCLDPQSALRRHPIAYYDFALGFAEGVPSPDTFYMIPRSAVHVLVDPDMEDLADASDLGGTKRGWNGWTWRGPSQPVGDDRLITTTVFATTVLPADKLAGHIIAYEAYTDAAGMDRTMRLQVNWLGKSDKLVSAQIKLVKLTASPQVFTMLLDRPEGAKRGEVYATMHEDGAGSARIRAVKVLRI